VTADGLTVESSTGGVLTLKTTDTGGAIGEDVGSIDFYNSDISTGSTGVQARILGEQDSNGDSTAIQFHTGFSTGGGSPTLRKRQNIASNGDISFYEDTGTNPSFVYDASSALIVNEDSRDFDFRVESDSNTHMLFVDAGNSRIGIANSGPAYGIDSNVDMRLNGTSATLYIGNGAGTSAPYGIASRSHGGFAHTGVFANRDYGAASASLGLETTLGVYTPYVQVNSNGETVVNETGSDWDFRVESDTNANAFFLDGATGYISIGHAAPNRPIHIKGGGLNSQILLEGTLTGYTEGSVICLNSSTNSPQTRGGGIYMADSSDNVEWFAGRPYGNNDKFVISRNGSYTNYGQESAQNSYAYVTVDSNGNVIINENSNDADFRVESNTNTHALFVDAGNNTVTVGTDSVGTFSAYSFGVVSRNNDAQIGIMNIGRSGGDYPYIGYPIRFSGTTGSHTYNSSDSGAAIRFGNDTLNTYTISAGTAGNSLTLKTGPYVASGGTSWTSSSDIRLKNVGDDISGGIEKIKAMRPVNFTWKSDEDNKNQIGFIAQEMVHIVPEVVQVPKEEVCSKTGETQYQGIEYEKLVPVLTAALKEAVAKIEDLETRLAALEAN
jgi:hypothetical protein